jgi:hypothetical protein
MKKHISIMLILVNTLIFTSISQGANPVPTPPSRQTHGIGILCTGKKSKDTFRVLIKSSSIPITISTEYNGKVIHRNIAVVEIRKPSNTGVEHNVEYIAPTQFSRRNAPTTLSVNLWLTNGNLSASFNEASYFPDSDWNSPLSCRQQKYKIQ